jgi:hypothetical protein
MKDAVRPTSQWALKAGLTALVCAFLTLSGCARSKSQAGSARKVDVICAEYWKTKGHDFDPARMTCDQMCERAAAMRRAEHWAQQGYTFDPNSMTAAEMDQHVESQIFKRLACCMIWYVSYAQTLQADGSQLQQNPILQ